MTIDQILTLFGQIATWITVVVVLLTLREMGAQRREMEAQRKSSYKPEIVFVRNVIFGYWKQYKSILLPVNWSEKEIESATLYFTNKPIGCILRLFNIGVGPAVDIKAEWEFDVKMLASDIKEYCYKHTIPIIVQHPDTEVERGDYDDIRIDIDGQEEAIYLPKDFISTVEYLLPASVDSKGLEVRIPKSIQILLSIACNYNIYSYGMGKAKLRVTYKDIGNETYSKEFPMKISFIRRQDTNIEDNCIALQINFEVE